MAKTAVPTLVLCTLLVLTVRALASTEKYQVDVALPSSSSDISQNITVPEGETLTVCVVRSSTTARLKVAVKGGTNPQTLPALGGIDYSPTEISLVFERSSENQTKCGEFSIIQDGMDEGQETFFLNLSQDNDLEIPGSITVNIDACKQGDIILTKSVLESFSIVEYCNDSTQWVILCDKSDKWTMKDATVVCRQAGRSGGEILHHQLGNEIRNARQTVPECVGNESRIDDCDSTNMSICNPVLVDCGSTGSGGSTSNSRGGTIAAAVTVPLLLVLALVCTVAITLFLLWKNGKLHWENCKLPNKRRKQPGTRHAENSRVESNSNSHQFSEPEAEYTAPFTGPSYNLSPTPVKPTRPPRQQSVVEDAHYEGCDMATLTGQKKLLAKRPIKNHPEVMPKPLKLEKCPEDYSHLQH